MYTYKKCFNNEKLKRLKLVRARSKLVSGEPQKGYNDRIKRPPNIIGAGAKKCGTIAFSTFLALNKQVLMVVLMA